MVYERSPHRGNGHPTFAKATAVAKALAVKPAVALCASAVAKALADKLAVKSAD